MANDKKKKRKTVGEILQEKAENAKDEKIKNALLKTDITGLQREEAYEKLQNAIKQIVEQ